MRVLKYEWVRARSLKSTWIFPLVGLLFAAFAAYLTVDSLQSRSTLQSLVNGTFTPLSTLFFTMGYAQAFGHDYRDGTMRLTLSAFPKRPLVFIAKVAIPTLIATCYVIATVLTVMAIGLAGGLEVDGGVPAIALRLVAFNVLYGILVTAFTVLTRNLVGGLMAVFVWSAVVEMIATAALSNYFETIGDWMPVRMGSIWAVTGDSVRGAWLMLGFAAIVGLLAFLKFTKRDA